MTVHHTTTELIENITDIACIREDVVVMDYRIAQDHHAFPHTSALAVMGIANLASFLIAAGRVLDQDHAQDLFGYPTEVTPDVWVFKTTVVDGTMTEAEDRLDRVGS